ncbi:MAG: ISAs1 family transposase [Gammaproteobacteria bacterium]
MSSRSKKTSPPCSRTSQASPGRLSPPRQTVSTLDKAHGRIERRTLTVSSELKETFPAFSFPGHLQVFRLERNTSKLDGSHPTTEVVYGVTSLSPEQASPARLLSLVRKHWGIEAHHWIRDAVFGEDKSATRKGSAPVFMTLLRNLAIALLRLSGRNQIAESLRFFSWKPSRAVSFLGF